MSTNDSRCLFTNCDCKMFISLKFQDKCLCKGCGHDTDLHTASVNFSPNALFVTPPSAPTPQCFHVPTDSNHAPTCQGTLMPHCNNFLPSPHCETTETVDCSATTNLQLMKIIQEFAPCDRLNYHLENKKECMSSQQYFIFAQTRTFLMLTLQSIKIFLMLLNSHLMLPLTMRSLDKKHATRSSKLLKKNQ